MPRVDSKIKVQFVLDGPGGELERSDILEVADECDDLAPALRDWMRKNFTVINAGDVIRVVQVEG